MRKIKNVFIIALLFASIFGVIDFGLNAQPVSSDNDITKVYATEFAQVDYYKTDLTSDIGGCNRNVYYSVYQPDNIYMSHFLATDDLHIKAYGYGNEGDMIFGKYFLPLESATDLEFVLVSSLTYGTSYSAMCSACPISAPLYVRIYKSAGYTDTGTGNYPNCDQNTNTLNVNFTADMITDGALGRGIYFSPYIRMAGYQRYYVITMDEMYFNITNYVPVCGDGTCQETEDCSTCEADCGSCYSGTVTNTTVTHTLTPSSALAGETVSGTVILTDGISRRKPDSVIIKNIVGGVESTMLFTSEPVTDDENFTHYEFIPLDNLLQPGDVTMVATATYNGVEYQGVSTLTILPPGEGTPPINPGDEGEVQDHIKWTFKFTKDVFDSSDYTPNYGVAGYYVVSAVPTVNGVDIPQYDAYVTVKVDSKIVLNNKYKHYLALASGSSGSTEPFYFDMPTSAVNIDGECLINYNYYGTPRTITLKDTSKFSLSGNGGGNGGGDSGGKPIFTKVWDGVKGVAGDVWDGVYGAAKEVAGDAKEAVEDVAPDIYKALQTVTSDVWKAVSSTASRTFESVVKTVTGGSSGGSIFSGLSGFLSKAVYGIPVIFIVIGVVLIIVLRRN